jgi:tetratricopeptide (TPR) repeat protein
MPRNQTLEQVFGKGIILAVKNPFFKIAFDGSPMIRVDDPSTVEFFQRSNERLLRGTPWFEQSVASFEQLTEEGNEFFRQKNFEKALELYERADALKPNTPRILMNKQSVFWNQERFWEAYQIALKAQEAGADPTKVLFRLGQTADAHRNWEAAIQHFTALLEIKEFPSVSEKLKHVQ